LLINLRGAAKRLQLSSSTSLLAATYLLRYLRYENDDIVRDITSVVAACLLLAYKVRENFKPKMFKKIVLCSYCQVFNREEGSVGTSADNYLSRSLKMEETILLALRHDLYVPDIASMAFAEWVHQGNGQTPAADETEIGAEELAEGEEEATAAVLAVREGGKASCVCSSSNLLFADENGPLENLLDLSLSLTVAYPSIWLALPSEMSTVCALFVDLLAQAVVTQVMNAPPTDDFRIHRHTISPTPLFLAVWNLATHSLGISIRQCVWGVGLFATATAGTNTSGSGAGGLEELEWFPDLRQDGRVPVHYNWTRVLSLVQELLQAWLERGLLSPPLPSFSSVAQVIASSGSSTVDTHKYKLRCPWLSECRSGSSLPLRASSSLTVISRDIYAGSLAANIDEPSDVAGGGVSGDENGSHVTSFLLPSKIRMNASIDVRGSAPVTLRSWPSSKQLKREIKAAQAVGHEYCGYSPR